MTCLRCGKPAEHTEDYQGIPIGICEDGHRTGLEKDPKPEQFNRDDWAWASNAF